MALIDELLAQAQRDLSAREVQIVSELLKSYGVALSRIERELRTIDAQIAELIASGDDIDGRYIQRQRWWREVEASIQREMARWSGQAANGVAALQSGGVTIGVGMSSEIATAAGSPFQGRVYANAFERWVGVIQPNSPLRTISLPRYEAAIRQSILQRMTEGIGSGKAPRSIVREIMRDVGIDDPESAVRGRLLTLSRTEVMRAFRGASADTLGQLQERGIVTGYVWLARLDGRTCPACLARHGQISPTPWDQFHPSCRCVNRAIVDPSLVPGGGWHGQTGEEWFAEQPETVQRQILVVPARYDAYASGVPLSDMVTVRHSDVWGDSIGVKPVSLLPNAPRQPIPLPRRGTPSTAATVLRARSVPGFAIPRAGD